MENLERINNIATKLRFLGNEVEIISDSVAISQNDSQGFAKIYKINKDGSLVDTEYDRVEKLTTSSGDIYLSAKKDNGFHLFNINLRILGIYYNIRPVRIIDNKMVVLAGLTSSGISTLGDGHRQGEFFISCNNLKLYKIGDGRYVANTYDQHNAKSMQVIIFSIEDEVRKHILHDLTSNNEVYVGADLIAIVSREFGKTTIYDYKGKVKLVIMNGMISINRKTNSYVIYNKYYRQVTSFERAKEIW